MIGVQNRAGSQDTYYCINALSASMTGHCLWSVFDSVSHLGEFCQSLQRCGCAVRCKTSLADQGSAVIRHGAFLQ